MDRRHCTAAADVTYPRSGNPFRVETMLVTYLDALGVEREVTVRLSRPARTAPFVGPAECKIPRAWRAAELHGR